MLWNSILVRAKANLSHFIAAQRLLNCFVTGKEAAAKPICYTKIQGKSLLVRGLNALAATICTPLGAPVIACAAGAAGLAAEELQGPG